MKLKGNEFTIMLWVFVIGNILIAMSKFFLVVFLMILAFMDALFTNMIIKKHHLRIGKKAINIELNPLGRAIYRLFGVKYGFHATFILVVTIVVVISMLSFENQNINPLYFMQGMYLIILIVHLKNLNSP